MNEKPISQQIESATTVGANEDTELFVASQWKLIWWKFREHKLALISTVVIFLMYLIAVFVEPLAPYVTDTHQAKFTYAPPMRIRIFDEGKLVSPYVYGLTQEVDAETLRRSFHGRPGKQNRSGLFRPR